MIVITPTGRKRRKELTLHSDLQVEDDLVERAENEAVSPRSPDQTVGVEGTQEAGHQQLAHTDADDQHVPGLPP